MGSGCLFICLVIAIDSVDVGVRCYGGGEKRRDVGLLVRVKQCEVEGVQISQ